MSSTNTEPPRKRLKMELDKTEASSSTNGEDKNITSSGLMDNGHGNGHIPGHEATAVAQTNPKVQGEETSMVVDHQVVAGGEVDTLSESGSQDLFEGQEHAANYSEDEGCAEGAAIEQLPRVGISAPSQYRPPNPSKQDAVLVNLQTLQNGAIPQPFPTHLQDVWDNKHVRVPWSKHCKYPVTVDNKTELLPRWELIKSALSKPFSSSVELTEAILSYHSRNKSGNNYGSWSFTAFHQLIDDLSEEEEKNFFEKILPGMVKLCLAGPMAITKPIPFLRSGYPGSITLSQYQVSVLLANAFFSTFPGRNNNNAQSKRTAFSNYPDINFNRLLSNNQRRPEAQAEKLKCILAYFRQVLEIPHTGLLTFTRQIVKEDDQPAWSRESTKLNSVKLRLASRGTIESDGVGMLQVDFANKMVGGGVLGQGLVQEEIRFTVCPELIISRLFTEMLEDNEVLIVHGAQQFTDYTGYGDSFEFAGRYQDITETDISCRQGCKP